jgi:hypothetical protein
MKATSPLKRSARGQLGDGSSLDFEHDSVILAIVSLVHGPKRHFPWLWLGGAPAAYVLNPVQDLDIYILDNYLDIKAIHCTISVWPSFVAHPLHSSLFHGAPFERIHLMASRWPLKAASEQSSMCHTLPF